MFSLSPALYRRPQAKAKAVTISLLLTSSLHDVINGNNIMFWSIFWQHNSSIHVLYLWVTKAKKSHLSERWSSWLHGCVGLATKATLPNGWWVTFSAPPSSPGTLSLSHLVIKPKHTLLSTLSESKKLESWCIIYQWRWISKSLTLKTALLGVSCVLPPLGRDSLKSPSVASQVLPSPPHTRHRSSLASELRMLSQPTCFEIKFREWEWTLF